VILPRPPAFAVRTAGLVLPFLALLALVGALLVVLNFTVGHHASSS
jgi:hypothetical protein